MFDEAHLISQCLKRIKKETRPAINQQSAFNESLDKRLRKLVFLYKFNFEAVALHLIEEFPQFQYKICKASVGFRWYQILAAQKPVTLEGEALCNLSHGFHHGQSNSHSLGNPKSLYQKPRSNVSESEQSQSEQLQEVGKYNNSKGTVKNQSISQLEKALLQAQQLAENQSTCFIAYKPNYHKNHLPQQAPVLGLDKESESVVEEGCKQGNEKIYGQEDDEIDYQYGYNYRQLEQEYNHYNEVVNLIGYGFHEDSATDESGASSDEVDDISLEQQNDYQSERCLQGDQLEQQAQVEKLDQEVLSHSEAQELSDKDGESLQNIGIG